MENFSIEVDKDGIALVTWDMPGRSMNVISESVMRELSDLVDRFQKDDAIKGVVLTSGKSSFCAGADLEMLESLAIETAKIDPDNTEQVKTFFDNTFFLNSIFRRMETCGKPVVAALTGTALGGGLEAALATHYRISVEDDRAKIGLPEALVGLLPGGGGTQRLPRMISVGAALPLIIQGQQISPKKAHEMGIINKLVSSQDELIPEAKKWILNEGTAEQPWDQKGYKVPGGNPYHPAANQNFIVGTAMLREKTFGNYPAQSYIMSCVYEGTLVPIDAGLRIESRYFAKLLMRSEARNMIRSIFMSKGELEKGARRPQGVDETHTEKVGILGAGLMGAGVAYVSAMAGIKVVLLDRDQEAAEKGKSYSTGLLEKRVSKGRMTEAKRDEILSLIHPTTDYADLKDCDLIIEAVFENSEIKAEVTKKTEAQIAPDAVFGTNTSTIPITDLAEASERPDNFIGVHFFSPVDKMML
ncbi:MAG: 3-hydroxyacyl-CoA dehydrogenase NAD-binding domain-containing protein, partial [Pseudomonadota bacterium]